MWSQVQDLGNDLMQLGKDHPEGLHFLGIHTNLNAKELKEYFRTTNNVLFNMIGWLRVNLWVF